MKQEEAFNILNEQIKDIPKAQIRSVSLAVLPRLMQVLDDHLDKCPHCQKFSQEGENYVNDIRPIFGEDVKANKQFEQWAHESQKHLKIEHEQYVKGRTTSVYITIGMAIGTLVAFIYSYFLAENNIAGSISIGWAIGLVVGYMAGKLKENKLRKNKQLY
ncbi:MAG: hypothetical protein N4A71_14465 [Carboxylicivirga sp.]|jgi:ABC-type phosphate/phosphonate transport system permease subunit|nr:hypothetical protein [Carboxylicivirga sp.]MCT4646205.1 hypothetical protein [Carboxylicivirga sp.]